VRLNPLQAAEVRARLARGESPAELARKYGVSPRAITHCRDRRKAWPEMWPGAGWTPFECDPIAIAVVNELGPLTLTQVGGIIGVTRERVRQIEEGALNKLRANPDPFARRFVAELDESRAA
jgi:hypothetical protein